MRMSVSERIAAGKQMAREIEAKSYGWTVLFGDYHRVFWACACWIPTQAVCVTAETPEALERAMRDVEALYPKRVGGAGQ
jgi:hypothetical protein